MIKKEELTNPQSCMSRAVDDEMTFVLLARDSAAPVAIEAWVAERIRLGKNNPGDAQIVEALDCADTMRVQAAAPALYQTFQPPPAQHHSKWTKSLVLSHAELMYALNARHLVMRVVARLYEHAQDAGLNTRNAQLYVSASEITETTVFKLVVCKP